MEKESGGRAVGRTVGGVPLAGNRPVLWAQSDATTAPHVHRDSGPDALEHQTLIDLVRLYDDVRRRGPRGENARAFAARIRTVAVYHHANGRSDAVRDRVAALVAERGREIVIGTAADVQRVQRTLRAYGIDPASTDVERFTDRPATARAATLDRLLAGGEAAVFEHGASVLERAAPSIDVHMAAIRPIRMAQVDDTWCTAVATEIDAYWYAGTLLSTLASTSPEFEGGCTAAWLAASYVATIYRLAGCT